MSSARYIVFLILVLVFSWPVLLQTTFEVWFLWLYPFVIWLSIIVLPQLYGAIEKYRSNNKSNNSNNN